MKILTYILVVYLLGGGDNQIVTTNITMSECITAVEQTMKMPNRLMASCYRVVSDSHSRIKIERFYHDRTSHNPEYSWFPSEDIDISGNK